MKETKFLLLNFLIIIFSCSVIFPEPIASQKLASDNYSEVQEAHFSLIDTLGGVGTSPGTTEPARIIREVPTSSDLDEYYGWMGIQLGATGRFRTENINGYWYFVDPLGHPFFSVAPNSVSSAYANVNLPGDLTEAGFNTLGNWSSHAAINDFSGPKIPYVTRVLFFQSYKNTSSRLKDLYNQGIIAVFDPEFVSFSNNLSKDVVPMANDPYCIGIFSDNELPCYDNTTYGNLLDRFLGIDKTDPNYIAANLWMIARKGSGYVIDATDREEFHGYLMGTYYRIVSEAIDKVAPDLLYLGSRLHGGAKYKPSLFREAGKYLDVISINFYGPYEPASNDIEMWQTESGKPFLITEFYAKAYDVGMENASGAGNKVPTQTDRAIYFENFSLKMLESKGCVGLQWHRFQDDIDPYVNKGFINENGTWYEPLKSSLSKITKDIYGLRDFLKPIPEGKMAALFDQANFLGQGFYLTEKTYSSADLSNIGLAGIQISSIKLSKGYKAVLFKGDNFTGDSLEIYESNAYLENEGFNNTIGSLKIMRDYRIIVANPLDKLISYKAIEWSTNVSSVFMLLGDESIILPVEIYSVTSNGIFSAGLTEDAILVISSNPGITGEGFVVLKAEYDKLVAYDTLNIQILDIPWNAPHKDTYVRGGDFSAVNYGKEAELLIKYSDSDNYTRISFLEFEIDPEKIPLSFNNASLVLTAKPNKQSVNIALYALLDEIWDENELIWDNQPSMPQESLDIQNVSASDNMHAFRFDISSYLMDKVENSIYSYSFVLKALEKTDNPIALFSIENLSLYPYLELSNTNHLDSKKNDELLIYPNPADSYLNISGLSDINKGKSLEMINLQGEIVFALPIEQIQNGMLNIENLSPGFYFLRSKSLVNTSNYKFIKN